MANANLSCALLAGGTGGAATGDVYLGFENMIGSGFNDTLLADGGANRLDGGGGNDWLEGRGGADWLRGDAGADTLVGGAGNDRLDGMAGNDTFVWNAASESSLAARDVIRDWNVGDLIDKFFAHHTRAARIDYRIETQPNLPSIPLDPAQVRRGGDARRSQ